MPKLISLLVCEKIIVSKDEAPTLVNVVQNIKATLVGPQVAEVPRDAVAPLAWAIFSIWEADESDIGKEFHQKNQIIMPDGTPNPAVQGDLPFTFKKGLNFNYINIYGFPVGLEGVLRIRVSLESSGKTISEHFYPVVVERTLPPSPNTAQTN